MKDRDVHPGPFFIPDVQLFNIICIFPRSSSLDPHACLCNLARILNENSLGWTLTRTGKPHFPVPDVATGEKGR
jgi:hypothetical protein